MSGVVIACACLGEQIDWRLRVRSCTVRQVISRALNSRQFISRPRMRGIYPIATLSVEVALFRTA